MRLLPLAAPALLAALFATPAPVAAQTLTPVSQSLPPAALDCVRDTAPAAVRTRIADSATAEDDAVFDAAQAELVPLIAACTTRFAVPEEKRDVYAVFGTSSVLLPELADRLRTAGLDPLIADRASGAGPSAEPALSEEAVKAMITRVVDAYEQASPGKLDEKHAALLGLYIGNLASYWALRSVLAKETVA